MLRALRWLKQNNSHYENIVINEYFRFDASTDNVIFDKAESVDDINFLITNDENDPYLLEPDEFDLQLVHDLDLRVPSGKSIDHYSLLKNPYIPFK